MRAVLVGYDRNPVLAATLSGDSLFRRLGTMTRSNPFGSEVLAATLILYVLTGILAAADW